jgi:hypothetical protein
MKHATRIDLSLTQSIVKLTGAFLARRPIIYKLVSQDIRLYECKTAVVDIGSLSCCKLLYNSVVQAKI